MGDFEENTISYEGVDETIIGGDEGQTENNNGNQSLESQVLDELNNSYTLEEERLNAAEQLQELDKKLRDYATRFLPNGIVPIMVTPAQQDNTVNSKYSAATWSEYTSQGEFAGIDDNYCRQMESGNWLYPRRNNEAAGGATVELGSCSTLMNEEVLLASNITDKMNQLITRAKISFIKTDTGASDPTNQSRTTLFKMITDYENLNRQYIQLVRNVNTNIDLLKRRTQTINKEGSKMEEQQNKVDIQNDIFNDWMDVEGQNNTRNTEIIKWSKYLLWVLWVLMVGIILLANTKFIVQN